MFWKKKRKEAGNQWLPPRSKVKYPKWTIVRAGDKFYMIMDKTRLEFISDRAAHSWGRPIVSTTEEAISGYKTWKKIGFAPGSMIKNYVDGSEYFITGSDVLAGERCLITTPDFFTRLGYDRRYMYVVSSAEVDFHRRGEDISG